MDTPKRRPEISVLNTLFCLAVILLHCLSEPVSGLDRTSGLFAVAFIPWKLACVAVYGFIFLSGLKLFLPGRTWNGTADFYRRRLRTILLPYLLAVTVYILFNRLFGTEYTVKKLLYCYGLGTAGPHFYFVVTILQFYLLMPLWRKMIKKAESWIAVPTAILIMIVWQATAWLILQQIDPDGQLYWQDRFFMSYIGVWVCGCYAGSRYDRFLEGVRRGKKGILVLFLLLAALNTWTAWLTASKAVWFSAGEAVNQMYILSAILAAFAAAAGPAGTRAAACGLLRRVDAASYNIYLYHMLVLLAANAVCNHLGIIGYLPRFVLRLAAVLLITVPICVLWNIGKERMTDRLSTRKNQGA